MHKFIVEDSTKCFTAMPDYVLIFTKKGENEVPVTHENGLKHNAGEIPILPNILTAWNNANNTNKLTVKEAGCIYGKVTRKQVSRRFEQDV